MCKANSQDFRRGLVGHIPERAASVKIDSLEFGELHKEAAELSPEYVQQIDDQFKPKFKGFTDFIYKQRGALLKDYAIAQAASGCFTETSQRLLHFSRKQIWHPSGRQFGRKQDSKWSVRRI